MTANDAEIKWAFSAYVKLTHPDTVTGKFSSGIAPSMSQLKQARDIMLERTTAAACLYCNGTGMVRQVGKLTRTSCPRGCKAN